MKFDPMAKCVRCGQTKRVCCSDSRLLRDGSRFFSAPQCGDCCQAPCCQARTRRAARLKSWGL